jgi:hypothetical protein
LACKAPPPNGHDKLEEALARLIQNQAAFVSSLAESNRERAEIERRHQEFERRNFEFERETKERFARIEVQMAEIIRVLNEHTLILERLPEAVRNEIGFQIPVGSR